MAASQQVEEYTLTFLENLEDNIILENLRVQRETGQFCDIILHVQSQQFPAHRSVLAASSPYFESVLKTHRSKNEIAIGWHDVKTFEMLLDYMYTGSVSINETNVYELLKLSNHFLIYKLKRYAEQYLEQFMNLDNCLTMRDLATKYNLQSLQEAATTLITENISTILKGSKSLLELSASKLGLFLTDPVTGCDTVPLWLLLNAISCWTKVDIVSRSPELPRLLDVINWKENDAKEIFDYIENEPLYQERLCLYLILRTLVANEVDMNSKYICKFNELKKEFEESTNEIVTNEVIVAGICLEDETKAQASNVDSTNKEDETKILCKTKPKIMRKKENKTDSSLSDLETNNKKCEVEKNPYCDVRLSSDRPKKRIIKQKYSSDDWIMESPQNRHETSTDYSTIECQEKTQLNASLLQWKEGVKCPHCIYVGHSATRLEQHLSRVHQEDTTYRCSMCDYSCKWNREYYKHMKTHFEGPPYKCVDCEYACDRIQFILSHRMRHTDERPFECDLCPFKSRTKGNLIVHMRIHTGEKPYKCQYCSRCFAMKNTLDQHAATHRDDRPFLCDTCGFTTKYQSHLLSHKRIHTGNVYHCSQEGCNYFSPRKSQLSAHMRSHLSIRSHICSTCGRGFIEKSHLIRHERIHLEDKPFKCEVCDYASTRRDKLKEHILKHHGDEKRKKKKWENISYIDEGSVAEGQEFQFIVTSSPDIRLGQNEQDVATANLIYEYSSGGLSVGPTRVVLQSSSIGDYTDQIILN